MKRIFERKPLLLARVATLLVTLSAYPLVGQIHYVAMAGQTPDEPYTNGWNSAASNIQAAVAVATPGSTIVISNGVYAITSTITNNGLVIRSLEGHPTNTTIDAGGVCRVFHVQSGTLLGLTITNGYDLGQGGGILFDGTGPSTARWCVVASCLATNGGGIAMLSANTLVDECVMTSNQALQYGGGVYLDHAGGILRNGVVSHNESGKSGGGVYLKNGFVTGCTISTNTGNGTGWSGGGGLYVTAVTASMCTVVANTTPSAGYGSGVMVGKNGNLSDCRIINNLGAYAIHANAINAAIRRCVVSGNSSGQGIYLGNSAFAENTLVHDCITGISFNDSKNRLFNCTIATNTTGIVGSSGASGGITNCIISGNRLDLDANAIAFPVYGYSCATALVHGVNGNITNNPRFVSAAGRDFRLNRGSPCFDAGFIGVTNLYRMDFLGQAHVDYDFNTIAEPDMGCYEGLPPPRGTIVVVN